MRSLRNTVGLRAARYRGVDVDEAAVTSARGGRKGKRREEVEELTEGNTIENIRRQTRARPLFPRT